MPVFIPTNPLFWLLVGPAFILGIWAQAKVRRAFDKYSQVGNSSGMSGAEAAAEMLRGRGIAVVGSSREALKTQNTVAIEQVRGFLSDHYDPKKKTLRLSPKVYQGRSLASVGVACHEAGHALQHAQGYAPLEARSFLVPVVAFGSWAWFPLFLVGAFLGAATGGQLFLMLGLLLFAGTVVFQLITLPVEFDASKRAKAALEQIGVIRLSSERKGVAAVLDAAAWTYIAAAFMAVMQLIYFILMVLGGSRR